MPEAKAFLRGTSTGRTDGFPTQKENGMEFFHAFLYAPVSAGGLPACAGRLLRKNLSEKTEAQLGGCGGLGTKRRPAQPGQGGKGGNTAHGGQKWVDLFISLHRGPCGP